MFNIGSTFFLLYKVSNIQYGTQNLLGNKQSTKFHDTLRWTANVKCTSNIYQGMYQN